MTTEFPPDSSLHSSEIVHLLRSSLIIILDGDIGLPTIPCWSTSAAVYYNRLAKHIETQDPHLFSMFQECAKIVRTKYRSHTEHELRLSEVPMTRSLDTGVDAALKDVCCCCLKSLNSHQRVVRLRSNAGDPKVCGHFLHYQCADKLRPVSTTSNVHCPLCRCNLGAPPIQFWLDTERSTPHY